jgi:hypothetical protein
MRIRVHPHVTELAGTGLVLLAFLLVALAISAAPVLVRSLAGRPAQAPHQAPAFSPSPGHSVSLS